MIAVKKAPSVFTDGAFFVWVCPRFRDQSSGGTPLVHAEVLVVVLEELDAEDVRLVLLRVRTDFGEGFGVGASTEEVTQV